MSLGKHCRKHRAAIERNGHPLAKAIKSDSYAYEASLVDALFTRHRDHPAISEACQFLSQWLTDADEGKHVPGQRELRQLVIHRVSPLVALKAIAAVFLYSHFGKLKDDLRLDYALANAMLNLAPKEKPFAMVDGKPAYTRRNPTSGSRREIGTRIRAILGASILTNAAAAIEKELERKQRSVAALHKPFPTTAVPQKESPEGEAP